MCTCIRIKGKYTYFGRNMDITHSFNERVIITPRNYFIKFKKNKEIKTHYSIIGIGTIIDNYPLYAEAINEYGLAIAGLNFPMNAKYYEDKENKVNLAPYELILYLLSNFKTINEVKEILQDINIINLDFSIDIKLTPLHFMVSDINKSIVIETTDEGMKVYDNPLDVLTNNPPFNYHLENIKNYLYLTNEDPINKINPKINIKSYSYGQGGMGLPGDLSSSSRFIRAFFTKSFLDLSQNEIHQFFKCLDSVSMIKGLVLIDNYYEYTRYSSCYNLNEGILYYKTYYSDHINSINMNDYKLDSSNLIYINII